MSRIKWLRVLKSMRKPPSDFPALFLVRTIRNSFKFTCLKCYQQIRYFFALKFNYCEKLIWDLFLLLIKFDDFAHFSWYVLFENPINLLRAHHSII